MSILESNIWVRLRGKNIKYYKERGYDNGYDDKILVDVSDLPKNSGIRLTKICDNCGEHLPNRRYTDILKHREDGYDYCHSCGIKKAAEKEIELPHEKRLSTTHAGVSKLLKFEYRAKYLSQGSDKKEVFVCPNCNYEITKTVSSVVNQGFSCSNCSDGISYPEKFMSILLNQLEIKFNTQEKFKWSNNKRYDFYIPFLKTIIETHGGQHYEETGRGKSLEEERENDRLKEKMAKENGVENYIVIDCRESELTWIKDNIINSDLNMLFDLSSIDWLKCHEFACSNFVKLACEMWELKYGNTKQIGEVLNLSRSTITKYLKQGNELGWCNYTTTKEVVQLDLDGNLIKEWKSIVSASKELNVNSSCISNVCKGKQELSGGYRWLYKEDYFNNRHMIIPYIKKKVNSIAIVQLDENANFIKVWDSAREADREIGIGFASISNCLKGKCNSAGGFKWVYKEEYDNDTYDKSPIPKKLVHNARRIVQLSLNMDIIKEFESIAKASDSTSVCASNISNVCREVCDTAGGFKWMYKEDYEKYINQVNQAS